MFRTECPKCGSEVKTRLPKSLNCEKCGVGFTPKKHQLFFKVRCAFCGEIIDQPLKNVNQHAPCPLCFESSFIPPPPPYQAYLDNKEAERIAEKEKSARLRQEKKARLADRKSKKGSGLAPRRRGRRIAKKLPKNLKTDGEGTAEAPKRHAVKKASGHEEEEILYECAHCDAGISQENIDREEAVNHEGQWYCWDHVPE